MLARICEGRAWPFVFLLLRFDGGSGGSCWSLYVGRWLLGGIQRWAFWGLDLSLRPCELVVGEPGALGRSPPGLLPDFPSTSSAVTGVDVKSGEPLTTTTAAFFALPFFHFGVNEPYRSWSPGFPPLDSRLSTLDSEGTSEPKQDLELLLEKVRTGRTSSQTAAVTRDLPPVNQSFPAVNPHLTLPGRAPPQTGPSRVWTMPSEWVLGGRRGGRAGFPSSTAPVIVNSWVSRRRFRPRQSLATRSGTLFFSLRSSPSSPSRSSHPTRTVRNGGRDGGKRGMLPSPDLKGHQDPRTPGHQDTQDQHCLQFHKLGPWCHCLAMGDGRATQAAQCRQGLVWAPRVCCPMVP